MAYAPLLLSSLLALVLFTNWWSRARAHRRKLDRLRLRIHVNGIRGKSTVTRLIAGLLREADYRTIAKTTGSSAAVIDTDGRDVPIRRRGAASILEQVWLVERWIDEKTEALVVECMALFPAYQAMCEQQMVRSNIGVLTNVREDHQDVMGATLPEIARSLMNTCPRKGILVTGEQDPALVAVLREEALRRGTRVIVADPGCVSASYLSGFSYVSFADNVAIALTIAELLGIPRATALRGMWKAAGDPGVLRVIHLQRGEVGITWANLFAVNDRESLVMGMEHLRRFHRPGAVTVGILNNRSDREARAMQFADVATLDTRFDFLVTLGAFERQVCQRLSANGFPKERILRMANLTQQGGEELLRQIIDGAGAGEVLLVGMVNIHTPQAERLLEALETVCAAPVDESEPQALAQD